jgi:hypothetical protein
MREKLSRAKKKQKTYIVSINVDDMIFPEIGTLEIEATSKKEALKWVSDRIRLFIEE